MKNWVNLANNLSKEEAILASRNTPQALKSLWEKGLAVVKQDQKSGEIIVFGGLWPTEDNEFLEAGSFWVHPAYREKKLSSWMFQELTKMIPAKKTAVCITKVPSVIHLLKKAGWQEATEENWYEVVPLSVSCGPCEKKEKKDCPQRASPKCRMFFYKFG